MLAASTATPLSPALDVGELARAHGPSLARLLRYLGVSSSEVEDALQDVFLVAHQRLSRPDAADRPDAWLRGVALNVARNRRRSARRSRVSYVDEPPEQHDAATPEAAVAGAQAQQRLLALLERLPEEQRAALVLFRIDGRPMKEVAATLGCALPTAYKYVSSAEATLEAALRDDRGGAR